jgi:hypothetical protein
MYTEPADRMRPLLRRSRCRAAIIPVLLCACAGAVYGDDEAATPMFSFGGFGTAGVVHSSADQADVVANDLEGSGAGYSHRWSAAVDSLLGLQLTANIYTNLSAVVQVISEQNYDSNYSPHVEWANIKYQVTPDFSVRVGRTAQPVFMVSDSRNIGYANPWVRPPVEVYNLDPVTTNDGVDLSYRVPIGAATDTLQVAVGQSNFSVPGSGPNDGGGVESHQQVLLDDVLEQGFASLRVSYLHSRITVTQFAPLFDAFAQFGAQGIAVSNEYGVNDHPVTFGSVSAGYDPGSWFAMGEWGRLVTSSALGDRSGWYVSGGYRYSKITAFATYGDTNTSTNRLVTALNPTGLPPALAGAAGALNGALNSILANIPVQDTISVGGRWDFVKNFDLKLQIDHTRLGAGSYGALEKVQPGFQAGSTVNVFSTTIDFVF